jgi:small GTP-binding protein
VPANNNPIFTKLNQSKHLDVRSDSPMQMKERRMSQVRNRNIINVILLGPDESGKSSFVIKLIEGKFSNYYIVTLGTEERSKQFQYKSKKYNINFIVTTGNQQYKCDYTSKYEIVDFFLVFYDLTSEKSFLISKTLVENEVKDYLFLYKNNCSNVFMVGNKYDLKDKQAKTEEISAYCKKQNFQHYEISVKSDYNVSKLINKILETFDDSANDQCDKLEK